jgi:Tol biopolymer transport system component
MKALLGLAAFLVLVPSATSGTYFPPPGDYLPQWSPDGTRLAYRTSGRTSSLAIARAADGVEERRLGQSFTNSRLSPDWSRFAELVGGELRVDGELITTGAYEFAWAPDSRRLIVESGPVSVINADGTGRVQVASRGGFAAWSPRGDLIAFQALGSGETDVDIYVAPADGSGPAVNLTSGDSRANIYPRWSPDARSIAFVTSDGKKVTIEITDLEGGRRIVPVHAEVTNLTLAWFPDSRRLAVQVGMRILAVDLTTGRAARFLPDGSGLAWSPDGTRVAFAQGGECRDRVGIYTALADGTSVRRLTNDCRIVGTPGDDRLRGTGLADVLLGLAGNDRLEGDAPGYVGDTLDGGPGADVLVGTFRNDTLFGRSGVDRLLGGPSGDLLVGGPGADMIDAQGGIDTIEARDGARDVIRCGTNRDGTRPEKDTVYADRIDRVARDCERVRRGRRS